jgi:glutamate racemase
MRALERVLPAESFVYLGDHGNAPYGNRPSSDIYKLTLQGLARLFGLGCSLVVIACNTAVATGLRRLQQAWLPFVHPPRRVIGIIVPVVEAVTGVPWAVGNTSVPPSPGDQPSHVAIFATRHTVQTGVFATEIGKRAPSIRVSHQACPALAKLIDCGAPEHTIRQAVRMYVAELLDASIEIPDMCILGCTHYPLVEHIFADELPKGIRLLSQAELTAASLKLYLDRHPQFSSGIAARSRYLTTGDARHVSALASRYYGRVVRFRSL